MKSSSSNGVEPFPPTYLNPVALCFLGAGLTGQGTVALFCMRNCTELIPAWSSNPLANTLACVQHNVGIEHRPGRCMLSVSQKEEPSRPSRPRARQKRLWNTPGIPWVVRSIWLICILPIVWAIIIYTVGRQERLSSQQNDFALSFDSSSHEGVVMFLQPFGNGQTEVRRTFRLALRAF